MSRQCISGLLGMNEVAGHAIGCRKKVKIVAVVQHVVHAAGCAALAQIFAVSVCGNRIAAGCR
jgi:hypothetical protein